MKCAFEGLVIGPLCRKPGPEIEQLSIGSATKRVGYSPAENGLIIDGANWKGPFLLATSICFVRDEEEKTGPISQSQIGFKLNR